MDQDAAKKPVMPRKAATRRDATEGAAKKTGHVVRRRQKDSHGVKKGAEKTADAVSILVYNMAGVLPGVLAKRSSTSPILSDEIDLVREPLDSDSRVD